MTPAQRALLDSVNTAVNAIPYTATPRVGEDAGIWKDEPDDAGDGRGPGVWVCRCYVLDKERELISKGWPALGLTVVECYTEPPQNEYHAVLCVEVDGEDWILDSRYPLIYRKDQAPFAYRWDRRQVAGTKEFEAIA